MSSLFDKRKEKMSKNRPTSYEYENHLVDDLVEHYKARLLRDTNLEALTQLTQGEMRLKIEQLVSQFMSEERVIISRNDKELLISRILDESVGYGPLEPLINDETITEILINGFEEIYVERLGKLEISHVKFRDDEHVRHVVDRIVAPLGRRIDESSPMVDARLPDGSRVNAVIPPISLNGTLVSIRKFRAEPFKMDDLLNFNTLNSNMSKFLDAVVKSKLNTLISGGTGSGKTTILNVLAASIPFGERVITIEDSAELRLDRPNVVGMEARPENVEGRGEVSIRNLVKNALRMRPDRIIVGEVRSGEAFDMLQAMNTGHEGSITTVHANSPEDALRRVEAMVVMAGMDLPSHIVREYIVGALDIIVQATRLTDGTRKIISISEVMKNADGSHEMKEIFTFKRTAMKKDGTIEGYYTATGYVPKCLERLKVFGNEISEAAFSPLYEEVST
ncbi:CpaF family protein [Rossellomorea aquimaris]|jgi:pilus assembly protein CpaF|uniref:Type II secretion system protein E n=1 Tax=Rossellomorea aquimaris TaxID=189382 RepID=A0A1J6WXX3_9BACI|nr:CpaF family protein [Rossellomorea aquimaris]OIU72687.1 type II secretion system protein E [Rossellomorea aquimaris]